MKSPAFLLAAALVFAANAAFAQASPAGSPTQAVPTATSAKAGTIDPNGNKDRRKTVKSKDNGVKTKTKTSEGIMPVDGKANAQVQ